MWLRSTIALLVLLVAGTGVSTAQQRLTGLPDLPFGSTPDSVRAFMLRQEGVKLEEKVSDDTTLTFSGGRFGKEPVHVWVFLFAEGQFARASITFKPDQHRVLNTYRRLTTALDTTYFPTSDRFELYEKPYRKGDGQELQAIVTGKGTMASFWTFAEKTPEQALIELQVTPALTVTLRYEYSSLAARYYAKKKAKPAEGA